METDHDTDKVTAFFFWLSRLSFCNNLLVIQSKLTCQVKSIFLKFTASSRPKAAIATVSAIIQNTDICVKGQNVPVVMDWLENNIKNIEKECVINFAVT